MSDNLVGIRLSAPQSFVVPQFTTRPAVAAGWVSRGSVTTGRIIGMDRLGHL